MARMTAATVEKLRPTDKRQEIPDTFVKGLYLTVQTSGAKSWQVRYRTGTAQRRMTLGRYPVLGLAEARDKAREVLLAAQEGADPAAARREVKAAKSELAERDTIRALVELHDKRHLAKLKSGRTVKRELDRHVVARWGDRDVHSITKRDVVDLLDELVDSGREITANRVRGYLGKFFAWCLERDVIEVSPMLGVKRPAKERSRDRVLSDDEVRWFWQGCEAAGWPWEGVGKLLLLTGQRLGEVVGMREHELDGDLWTLPADRTKNGRVHTVPLSAPALAVIKAQPRIGRQGLIFTTTGNTPLSGFDGARNKIAAAMDAQAAEDGRTIEHWTFHDLRRTAATGLARLGIPVRVTEAVLNHVSGTGGGIVAVYQRHDYADEKRQALEAWARYVADLVEGKADNVIELAGKR